MGHFYPYIPYLCQGDLNINPLITVTLPNTVATIGYSTGTYITNAIMNEIVAAAAPKSHSLTT